MVPSFHCDVRKVNVVNSVGRNYESPYPWSVSLAVCVCGERVNVFSDASILSHDPTLQVSWSDPPNGCKHKGGPATDSSYFTGRPPFLSRKKAEMLLRINFTLLNPVERENEER